MEYKKANRMDERSIMRSCISRYLDDVAFAKKEAEKKGLNAGRKEAEYSLPVSDIGAPVYNISDYKRKRNSGAENLEYKLAA